MEEIKLPKFKTKEELEQFAMGLMTENESLKLVIKKKDETIKIINLDLTEIATLKSELSCMKFAKELADKRIKELLERTSKDFYKNLYFEMRNERDELANKNDSLKEKISWERNRINVLAMMVSFLLGILPWFKKRRFEEKYGKFNPKNYEYT
jgi:hypothetical protein